MYEKLKTYLQENFSVKFFLTFTLVMLAMSCILATLFIRHQSNILRGHLIHQGNLLSDMMAYNSRLGVFSENQDMLEDVARGGLNQNHVLAVAIYNKDHKTLIVKAKNQNPERIQSMSDISKTLDLQHNENNSRFIEKENEMVFGATVFSRPQYLNIISPFFDGQQENQQPEAIGYVCIIISKKELNAQINQLFFASLIIGIFFWISGSGLMFAVVRGLTNPLFRLTQAVNRMGRTGNIRRLDFKNKDEIGKLADAFNNMSEAIKQREHEKFGLEEQLRQAQKMEAIGTLAGGIAHDFNNILGAIHGFTELGLLEAPEGSIINEKLKEIDFATTRAADLVQQILTFSRQKDELRNPIFVSTITKEVLKLLSPSIPPSVKIVQEIDPNCGMVLSNATTIHQIIMNLCTNALHAMKKNGGNLTVWLTDVDVKDDKNAHQAGFYSGRFQKLIIKDEGHGIPEEIIEHIFDPFFTTKKAGEGTGMGLSVVHGIVKRQKGFVHVASSPGKGSTFSVYLPLVDLEAIPQVPKKQEVPMGSGNILLVEDDLQLIESTAGMLESLGYRVEKKTKSVEAIEYFKQNLKNIDLVITDMAMPELNGVGLAVEIHRISRNFPVILTTGYSEMIDENKAKAMGLNGFLLKPIKRSTLAISVRKIIDQTHAAP